MVRSVPLAPREGLLQSWSNEQQTMETVGDSLCHTESEEGMGRGRA